MLKIVDNDSFNWDEEPLGSIIKVSSAGLVGSDRKEFLKSASANLLDKVDSIKVNPGEELVHLIALGTTENYGPNRNGDGFSKQACKDYHHYFVKDAKVYRNHKNTDPKKSYGVVKASEFNDEMNRVELIVALNTNEKAAKANDGMVADKEMEKLASDKPLAVSMACFLDPEYPILVKDKGYIPIKDVEIGMEVWTKEGSWKAVTELNRRKYTGKTVKIHINGLPIPLLLTEDHPMWAKCFPEHTGRAFSNPQEFDRAPVDWVKAGDLHVDDRLYYKPLNTIDGYSSLDSPELGAIMGYYLAEGSFGYNGERACTTQFSCNMSDSLPRRMVRLVHAIYPNITITIRPQKHSSVCLSVEVFSTEFSEFLRKYIGVGCKRKVIPPEIFNATEETKKSFLGAWLDGDGFADNKGVHWSTTNRNLVLQGRDLLATLSVPSSIYKVDHSKCPTSGMLNSGVEYTLNVSYKDAGVLAPYSEKVAKSNFPAPSRLKPSCMRLDSTGMYSYRIKDIEYGYAEDTTVYNFEVVDDHSYSAAGLVSHNCRVPFDVCSYCGNKAHTRDEYCKDVKDGGHCKAGGLKHNLGKMASVDGKLHQLYADNTQPYFFDISHVFVPADRIAYASGFCKKANTELIGGAELAELYGVSAPEKRAYYNKQEDCSHLFRIFFDAVHDFHNNKGWTKVGSYLSAVDTEPLSSPETTWQYSSGTLTKTLNDQHICLTPTQFLQVETGLPLAKCAALGEIIGPLSNERFKELLVSDDVFNPYMPQGQSPEKLRNWGYRQKCARFDSESSMLKQAAHNSLSGLPPVTVSRENIYSFEDDETAKRLSTDFALYKVAFLSSVPESEQKAIADLLVGRDYLSY